MSRYLQRENVLFRNSSVDAVLMDSLKQFVVIAIIAVYANEHGPWSVKRLLKYRRNLIWRLNHESLGTESLGVFDWIDRAELYPGRAPVLLGFLHRDHIIAAIDPNHVD